MKRIKITVLLILLCVLAGCSPKDTSLRAYCTESQQEFLAQSLEELPVALTYHHNDNILGRYETTDASFKCDTTKNGQPKEAGY